MGREHVLEHLKRNECDDVAAETDERATVTEVLALTQPCYHEVYHFLASRCVVLVRNDFGQAHQTLLSHRSVAVQGEGVNVGDESSMNLGHVKPVDDSL